MSDIAIHIKNLSKRYQIGELVTLRDLPRVASRVLTAPFRALGRNGNGQPAADDSPHAPDAAQSDRYFWALRDINLKVSHGEVLGIIGRNGAGKSTLLKVLSRITAPTTGTVEMYGRVASLLEVGTGMHQELTGRENIYLNGAILGMRKAEIDRKFDEIVAFADVEKFIDTPVKRYSSGMRVRLGFAVAAHLDVEILIVDEVLAVGDAGFQKRCLGKMKDVAGDGRTVLFVSHNMGSVSALCDTAILLDQGRIVLKGKTTDVIDSYLSTAKGSGGEILLTDPTDTAVTDQFRLTSVQIKNIDDQVTDTLAMHKGFSVEIAYDLNEDIQDLRVGVRLLSAEGVVIFTTTDTDPGGEGTARPAGGYVSRCVIPGNLLNAGTYTLTVAADRPMRERLFFEENMLSFTIVAMGGVGSSVADGRLGIIRPPLSWEVTPHG